MPRLHPRQRLIREALAIGVTGLVAFGYAFWWVLASPAIALDSMPSRAIAATNAVPQLPPPAGVLWRPTTDAPTATIAPPPTPTFRLITLSQRQGTWMALVDPGNGAATERLRTGDTLAGWQATRVDAAGVELQAGTQQFSLHLGK